MISTKEWRDTGSYFAHRGHRIFWREEGNHDAPVLLLIHGFPTASWDYERIWPELVRKFRVLTLDMLGFGFSDKPLDYDYVQLDQADIYDELLLQRGVSSFHVIAHDYGTSVAEELIARDIDDPNRPRLRSVCFFNGGLFPEAHHKVTMQKELLSPLGPFIAQSITREKVGEVFETILSKKHPPTPSLIDAVWELISTNDGTRVFPKLVEYMPERIKRRDRWVGAVLNTSVPLKVINGSLDPISGIHEANRFRELVPNPDVTDLSEVGHYPHVEAPGLVLKHYFAFRDRIASGT